MTESALSKRFLQVIPRTMWSIRTEMRSKERGHITVPQFRVMAQLSKNPATTSELAIKIGISNPAMSRMIDGLTHKALVIRKPNKNDRRQVQLELSKKGRAIFERILGETENQFTQKFSQLDVQHKKTLADAFEILEGIFQ